MSQSDFKLSSRYNMDSDFDCDANLQALDVSGKLPSHHVGRLTKAPFLKAG